MGRVVVVGSSNTDFVVEAAHIACAGETLLGGTLGVHAGGKGANQAVAAARAGARVAFVGAFGADDLGRAAVRGLRTEGIGLAHAARKRRVRSGVALITVARDGENAIVVAPGANARLAPADVSRAAPALRRADVVLAQLEVPLETVARALRLARKAGARTILNPAPAPAKRLPRALLEAASFLTPNRGEFAALTRGRRGAPAKRAGLFFDRGVEVVIVTLGSAGVDVVTPGGARRVRAFRARPVDTVGAGDCFNGALAAELARGAELLDATRFAAAAASLSVEKRGAQASMPTRRAILRRLKRGR